VSTALRSAGVAENGGLRLRSAPALTGTLEEVPTLATSPSTDLAAASGPSSRDDIDLVLPGQVSSTPKMSGISICSVKRPRNHRSCAQELTL